MVDGIEVGQELETIEQTATLQTSVRYAGASTDYNPLHYDQEFAAGVSPTGGIIAHGMFSMGLASRLLTAFAGDPGRVDKVDVRFKRPWPLGETATFGGEVTKVEDDVATVALWGRLENGDEIVKGVGRIRR